MFDNALFETIMKNSDFMTVVAYALVMPIVFGYVAFGIDRLLRLILKGNVF